MNNDSILRMIGLARRAGKIAFGANLVVSAIRSLRKPSLVLMASDASDNTKKKNNRRLFLSRRKACEHRI